MLSIVPRRERRYFRVTSLTSFAHCVFEMCIVLAPVGVADPSMIMMHALCPCGHVALGFCSSPDMRATSAARSVYIERAEPISRGPSTLGAHAPMPCIFQDVLLPHDRKHAHGRRPRARMRSLAIGRAPVGEALPPPAWRGVLTSSSALAQATS